MKFFLSSVILLFFMTGGVRAAETSDTLTAKVHYRINSSDIDSSYEDNDTAFKNIFRFIKYSPRIDSIVIYSHASPEGSLRFNEMLSLRRGEAVKDFISRSASGIQSLPDDLFRIYPQGEDWQGLRRELVERYHRRDSATILAILDMDEPSYLKEKRLRKDRRSWNFIAKEILPGLRYAEVVCIGESRPVGIRSAILPPPVYASACESVPLRRPLPAVAPRYDTTRRTVLAFRTNLLYDLATLLNVSAEAPLGDHFSILYEHQFPWWRGGKHRNALCLRYLQMSGEFRWWFSPYRKTFERYGRDSRLTGHYLGLYGMGGKYDFEYYRKICYQGEFWSAGLSYGYSLPIGRRANIEFSLSVGYARIPYRHFIPSEDYSVLFRDRDKSGTLNYIGPTKIGITLTVPITAGRIDKSGKGGGR